MSRENYQAKWRHPCSSEGMPVPDMLKTIAERLQTTATVKSVYGEPVTHGDRTVVPVARVRYGFGAGGGHSDAVADGAGKHGGGGGGGLIAAPAGALEITASGTRFIRFNDPRTLGIVFGAGCLVGLVAGWLVSKD